MKKFINNPRHLLQECLLGFAAAHTDIVQVVQSPLVVIRRERKENGVALISGGGSGHEPLHIGMVGMGMLDAACPGQVFTSPTPDQMIAAARLVDNGSGVLFIVKNYAGDVMNFQMACEMLDAENLTVLVNDDVAVENSTHTTGRRGVAGTLMVEKMVGAAAQAGASLYDCKRLGDRVNAATASMGLAFTSCTVPESGVPTFEIDIHEVEMGVGIHGEPGRRRDEFRPAKALAKELMDALLADLKPAAGQRVLVHINGLGATPLMELYLLLHMVNERLLAEGLEPTRTLVGNYTTALDMAGASITLTLLDDEMIGLWDSPVCTAALRW